MKRNYKRSEWKERMNYSTRTKNLVLVLLVFLFFFTISIGFSMLSQTLGLNTNVEIRPNKDIRITNVDGPYLNNGAYENGNYQYSHDLLISKGVLPNKDSTIQYKLTVTNNSVSDKTLDEVLSELLGGVNYRLIDFQIGDEVPAGESKVITIEFYNPTTSSITYSGELNFSFSDSYVDITAPTITFNPKKDSWFNKNTNVVISATDDRTITEFKYCTTSRSSCTPTTDGNIEGTTISLTTEGKHTICVLAVDNAKNPNSTSECGVYTIDKTAPVITVNGSGENQTVQVRLGNTFNIPKGTVTDNLDSNSTVTTSGNVNTSNEGTYTVTYTAKDKVGNTSTLTLTVIVYVPTLQAWADGATTDFHNSTYKANIITGEFLTSNVVPANAVASWDVSELKNGSVKAWVIKDTTDNTKYHLYIGGEGKVFANSDSAYLFKDFTNLKAINGMKNFDTNKATLMKELFYHCESLTSLDLSYFDTSKVTNMYRLFSHCKSLTSLDLSHFDTSSATAIHYMFYECNSLKKLDLSNFNTNKVSNMGYMFYSCDNLEELTLNIQNTNTVVTNIFTGTTKLHQITMNTKVEVPLNNDHTGCAPTGYTYRGWFDNSAATGNAITSIPAGGNGTFYAKWTPTSYTITWNLNSGSLSGQKTSYNIETADYTLPTPTRTGYTFGGWYTASDFSGSAVTKLSKGSTGNKTYYAKWTPTNYTITYTLNGGSITGQKTSYNIETATFTLPTPTRTGYTFTGWTGSNGTTAQTSVSIAKGSTGNKSYTANWSANAYTYNIVYKSNSGKQLGTATAKYNYGTTNTISPKAFTGYTSPANQSIAWDSVNAKTITFTYTPTNYTITWNLNSGSLSGQKTSYNIETADYTLPTPTRSGYEFVGWYDNPEFTGEKIIEITSTETGNKTFYAKWVDEAEVLKSWSKNTYLNTGVGNGGGRTITNTQTFTNPVKVKYVRFSNLNNTGKNVKMTCYRSIDGTTWTKIAYLEGTSSVNKTIEVTDPVYAKYYKVEQYDNNWRRTDGNDVYSIEPWELKYVE